VGGDSDDEDDGDDDEAEQQKAAKTKKAMRNTEKGVNWTEQMDRGKRALWEEIFVNGYLAGLCPSSGIRKSVLARANKRWKTVDGPFLIELRENYDLATFPQARRKAEENLLWSFRGEATVDRLQQTLSSNKYKILHTVFQFKDKFECLEQLSDVLTFQYFLVTRYSHRKSRLKLERMSEFQ
jgi:hypothetical protein